MVFVFKTWIDLVLIREKRGEGGTLILHFNQIFCLLIATKRQQLNKNYISFKVIE